MKTRAVVILVGLAISFAGRSLLKRKRILNPFLLLLFLLVLN